LRCLVFTGRGQVIVAIAASRVGLRGPWVDGYRELWVDSQTFLPVRFITADFANQNGPLKNVRIVGSESWLPRTTKLVNMVNHVDIPAGFTQVAPPK
jgi:hypothetical protein